MSAETRSQRHGLMWLGTSLAIGLIVSTVLAMGTVERIKLANQTIMVKGCAEKLIESDVVSWSAGFSAQASQLDAAYTKLKNDLAIVEGYLQKEGVPQEEISMSSIFTQSLYGRDERGNRTDTITGYRLRQSVHIRSSDLERITRISRECTDLIEKGVEIDSSPPQYFYTRVDESKLEMLGEAARDARQRAERLAKDSGSKVGPLRSTSQGVFQITSAESTEVSNYGVHDTSSWKKKIRAVVTVRYSIR
jgi:hypothetical protein